MTRKLAFAFAISALIAVPVAAQTTDAQAVLRAAAANMGVANMTSIQYSGSGWVGAVGQNFAPDRDWPRFDLKSYTRTIDFNTMASREDMVVVQGANVQQGGGGTPIVGEQTRTQLVSGNFAWNMNGNTAAPQPAAAEQRALEIMLTP